MKLESTGFKFSKRAVDESGSVVAMIEQMTNGKWGVFINEKQASLELFDKPAQALKWVKETCK